MLNLSAIPPDSLLGKTLRSPLRLVPKEARVRVLTGPMRGKRWIAGSSHVGCWLGTAELLKVRRVASILKPGMKCIDVGANVGYYTLIISVLVGPKGKVYAFEPLPKNLDYLERHIAMNRCSNVEIFDAALSDFEGEASFAEGATRSMGHLDPGGTLKVRCTRLDTMLAEGAVTAPDFVKIDAEGEEVKVLEGAREMLRASRPPIFLSTHSHDLHTACCGFLTGLGYTLEPLDEQPIENSREMLAHVA